MNGRIFYREERIEDLQGRLLGHVKIVLNERVKIDQKGTDKLTKDVSSAVSARLRYLTREDDDAE